MARTIRDMSILVVIDKSMCSVDNTARGTEASRCRLAWMVSSDISVMTIIAMIEIQVNMFRDFYASDKSARSALSLGRAHVLGFKGGDL